MHSKLQAWARIRDGCEAWRRRETTCHIAVRGFKVANSILIQNVGAL